MLIRLTSTTITTSIILRLLPTQVIDYQAGGRGGIRTHVTSLSRSISRQERVTGFVNIHSDVPSSAPIMPHEVPQYGLEIFYRKGFLLCGPTYPHLGEPLPPRHPWGPVASAAARFYSEVQGASKPQGLNMKGGAPLHLFPVGPTQLAIPKRPAVGSALYVTCIQTEVTGAPLHTFLSRELG